MPVGDLYLHRIGLAALRTPRITLVCLSVVIIIALIGASRLTIDPSLTRLFHGQTDEFAKFEKLLKAVPAAEQNVIVLVSGKGLMTPRILAPHPALPLELRLIDTVRDVSSIFTVREPISGERIPSLVIPEQIPTSSEMQALEATLTSNANSGNRFFANDGDLQHAVFSLSLDPAPDQSEKRDLAILETNSITGQILEPTKLKWVIGGVAKARLEMLQGIEHDFLFLNSIGFLLGTLICVVILRNIRLVVLAGLCPLAGAVVGIGIMGASGVQLSPLMTAIPLLVMAITFTDAMHLLHSMQMSIRAGRDVKDAVIGAVSTVGPACVLASLTTALALLSLTLSGAPMVSAFGIWASVANLIGVVVLLMLLPALAVLSLKPASIGSGEDHLGAGNATPLLELLCSKIGIFTLKRSYVIAVVGICITIALTAVYAQLSPLYRLSDQLPADSSFRRVNATLDAHFSGSNRIAIVISQQFGETASPVRLLDAVKEAHLRLAAIDGLSKPLSILSLLGSKPPLSWPSSERLSQWISAIPASKTKGLLNHVDGVAILLVDVPDLESGEIKRIVQTIERRLHATSQMFADHQFTVTGMPVLLAKEAPKIVRQINVSLAAALVLVFGVIGLAFRSFKTAVVSVVPNVLPIAAAGTFVYLMVGGLDYASVIGLTVAFGLAVDDSIHYLNRVMAMSEERSPTDQSILGAIRSTGPVLIATTAILFSTLAITVFGSLPPTQIFGQTCAAMLVAALLADLFILPALTRVIFVTD